MEERRDDLPDTIRVFAPWTWSAASRSGLYSFIAMLVVFAWMFYLVLALN